MYTRCPECHTCFRITDRQLAMANGKVRCGKCTKVFNAREHALDEAPDSRPVSRPVPAPTPPPRAQHAPEPSRQNSSTRNAVQHHQKTVVEPPSKPATGNSIKPGAIDNGFSGFDETIITPSTDTLDHGKTPSKEISSFDETMVGAEPFSSQPASSSAKPATTKKHPGTKLDIEEAESYHEIVPPSSLAALTANNLQSQLPFDISDDDEIESIVLGSAEEFISLDDDLHSDSDPFADDDPFGENDFEVEKRILADLEKSHVEDNNTDSTSEASLDDIFGEIETAEASEEDIFGGGSKIDLESIDDVPLRLRDNVNRVEKPRRSLSQTLLMLFASLLLSLLLALQAVVFRSSDVLAMMPQSQPWLEKFCDHVPCLYSGPRDVEQIDMVSRDVRLHPQHKDILLISAAMKNRASFAQPYPDIELVLSDISGNIVAQRRFTPKEYMGKLNSPFLLMKTNQPVHLKLEVVDPGKDAVNFVFKFR